MQADYLSASCGTMAAVATSQILIRITVYNTGTNIRYALLFDFSLTVKAAPHECVIRTSQP